MKKIIIQTGGIGDLILLLGTIKALEQKLGQCEIYTPWPEVVRFYTDREVQHVSNFTDEGQHKVVIYLNTFGRVYNYSATEELTELQECNDWFIKHYNLQHYLELHPFKDGIASELMVAHGYNRFTLPYSMLGLENVEFISHKPDKSKFLHFDKYITVHDGVSTFHEGKLERATKTWDLTHWKCLIEHLKDKYPDHHIIQIGSSTSRRIPGVDFSFLDSFNIEESFKLLAYSSLHIDGDSGLVHAARSFGVRAVVLFGPTPANFFGHPENINITAPFCSPCWWKTDTWLKQCVKTYKVPMCMNSITPNLVMDKLKDVTL